MKPTFQTFLHCIFREGRWDEIRLDWPPADLPKLKDLALGKYFSIFRASLDDAMIELVDMSYNIQEIIFLKDAIIAVAPGLIRYDSNDVKHTDVKESKSD